MFLQILAHKSCIPVEDISGVLPVDSEVESKVVAPKVVTKSSVEVIVVEDVSDVVLVHADVEDMLVVVSAGEGVVDVEVDVS